MAAPLHYGAIRGDGTVPAVAVALANLKPGLSGGPVPGQGTGGVASRLRLIIVIIFKLYSTKYRTALHFMPRQSCVSLQCSVSVSKCPAADAVADHIVTVSICTGRSAQWKGSGSAWHKRLH